MYGPTEPQEFREDTLVVRSLPGAGDTPRDGETPRDEETPRGGHTVSTVSEEESVSEWELERQKVSYTEIVDILIALTCCTTLNQRIFHGFES